MKSKAQLEGEKRYTRAERRREERENKKQEKHRSQKIKEAIIMLNDVVKLKLGVSGEKVGVFAMRDIKKGERMYANAIPCLVDIPYKDFKKLRPEISQMILSHFPQAINGSHFLSPDTLMQIYLNHSEEPNYDADTDKALKTIKEGTEVLQDYRKIKDVDNIIDFIK